MNGKNKTEGKQQKNMLNRITKSFHAVMFVKALDEIMFQRMYEGTSVPIINTGHRTERISIIMMIIKLKIVDTFYVCLF